MKKLLLFSLALSTGLAAMAQNAPVHQAKLGPYANKSIKMDKQATFLGEQTIPFSDVYSNPTSTTSRVNHPVSVNYLTSVSILNTGYQTQTNGAARNSIVMNADGTISTANILSAVPATPWNDRGTGYNYFDGSVWYSPSPTVRIETERTGYGDVAVTSSLREHVIAHNTTPAPGGKICYETRPVKGTGAWTENQNAILSPSVGNLWPQMVSGGANNNSLHAISITIPTGTLGGSKYMQQDGALCYAKSTDEGVTWSSWTAPPIVDSAQGFSQFWPNSYSIDARGNTIAIAVGGEVNSTVLLKSTDNGVTWTKTLVHRFPIANFVSQQTDTTGGHNNVDTILVNDGSTNVVLDNNNMAHVFFGTFRMSESATDSAAGGWSFYPGTDALYYWNENMVPGHPRLLTGCIDIDNDGMINLPTPPANNFPFGCYQGGMCTHPSAGVDGNNHIFLAYDAVIENTDDGNGHAYRNVYAMGSNDGGVTWSTPYRLIDPLVGNGEEEVYPSVPRHFTGPCFPVTYVMDLAVGSGLYNQPTGQPDPFNGFADVMYGCMSISTLMGTHEEVNNLFNVSDNYPNPFSGSTNITITMNKASRVTLDIFNPLGAKVAATVSSEFTSGEHTMTIDGSKLSAGIYFYTVRAGEFTVTKKMIIE